MNPKKSSQTIVIAAGGTSGHIYPAFAIASAIREALPSVSFIFCGAAGGLEQSMVESEGYTFRPIPAQNMPHRKDRRYFSWAWKNMTGVLKSRSLLKEEAPLLVIGTGGFVSAPLIAAARCMKIPYILHEQNAVPGRANRLFARRAQAVFISYESSRVHLPEKGRIIFSGNPVRPLFLELDRARARETLGLGEEIFLIMAMGGSLGSRTINTAFAHMDDEGGWTALMARYPRLRLVISTGVQSSVDCAGEIAALPGVLEAEPFFHDAPYWIAACDLFIGRAGAMTCAEISSQGKPSVLIPFPHAVDDHQTENARAMEEAGASLVLSDEEFNSRRLLEILEHLIARPDLLQAMSESAHRWATPDAAAVIAGTVASAVEKDEMAKF
ncbi:MAG TPA: undecaprenyldiphospho-muramoylpentapeptide beta-N-acetylglucosaminyltransferase [Bacillota bacterium]|jgi:UDP-N-acetylglucosamine--N-acetylmuramyl-(pentapeptide) pyrophosphoryl-undecaprenol N-acetylglucosamine transferase|nr:undecaprenyldiphospho-muramoylpentapeptide beta-N-acetylglucosaminyltransferase [Fastidiosipila sp.]HPX92915.1 undecaprenyldiphospho-muramoylpentapeptide beta-N-acetylglucosaminyltransferase [Bacillota bacterium]HQB80695.1 undecaprenyldiphospho-muramoylpentapeptide beta-N-acetylglucosaminyltransferase [Bacillota bacterium]